MVREIVSQFIYDTFLTALALFIGTGLLEIIQKGAAVHFFNTNILLALCLVSGCATILLPPLEKLQPSKAASCAVSVITSLGVGALLWRTLVPPLDRWSLFFIAMAMGATGVLLHMLLHLLYQKNN